MLERDTSKLEAVKAPFPRCHVRRGGEDPDRQGTAVPVRRRSRRHRRDRAVGAVRSARCACTHYPAAVKAFYMKPDPEQPDKALCVDVLAPEGYGEIIGGGQRLDDLRPAAAAHQGAQAAAGGVRVVSRPAPLRLGAARRLRHGHRARRRAGSAAWSTCARRFRIRGCCTGCIRRPRPGTGHRGQDAEHRELMCTLAL